MRGICPDCQTFHKPDEPCDLNRLTGKPHGKQGTIERLHELHKGRGGTLDTVEPVNGNPFHGSIRHCGNCRNENAGWQYCVGIHDCAPPTYPHWAEVRSMKNTVKAPWRRKP